MARGGGQLRSIDLDCRTSYLACSGPWISTWMDQTRVGPVSLSRGPDQLIWTVQLPASALASDPDRPLPPNPPMKLRLPLGTRAHLHKLRPKVLSLSVRGLRPIASPKIAGRKKRYGELSVPDQSILVTSSPALAPVQQRGCEGRACPPYRRALVPRGKANIHGRRERRGRFWPVGMARSMDLTMSDG